MSNKPIISVIVPVYNTEKYLRRCLDSICHQSYCNLEIICVNDGSTDNSAAILKEYEHNDKRIKIITQKNAGLSAARNAALNIASGEWIAGVDSDDYLELDAYEYALTGAKDDVDIICFGTEVVYEDGRSDESYNQYFHFQYTGVHKTTSDLIQQTNVVFWNKLWRKNLIDRYQNRFPQGLLYEDIYFYYTLMPYARKVAFLPDKKIYYIQRVGAITSQIDSLSRLDHLLIARAILNFYRQHPLPRHHNTLDLHVFDFLFSYLLTRVTGSLKKQFWKMAQAIAKESGLIRQYSRRLRFLKITPWFLKPFIKHTIDKSSYGLPGLPFVIIKRQQNMEIVKLFGKRIRTTIIPYCLKIKSNPRGWLPRN